MDPRASISNIAPELLTSIFEHLELNELRRILPTSKRINDVASPVIRRELDEGTLKKLSDLRHAFIEFNFGGENGISTEFTIVGKENTRTTANGLDKLSKAVEDSINDRDIKIVNGSLSLHPKVEIERFGRLFEIIKSHSQTRSAAEFSIHSLTATLKPSHVTTFFDTQKLTKLDLAFQFIQWGKKQGPPPIVDPDWEGNYAENPDLSVPSIATLKSIRALTDIFKQSPNLVSVTLRPEIEAKSSPFKYAPLNLPAELEELRTAFEKLEKLQTVHLGRYLFHPSFFLHFPVNTKKLTFEMVTEYSKSWWIQFSKFPFKRVEEINLTYPKDLPITKSDSEEAQYDKDGTLRSAWDIQNRGFYLGDVQMRWLQSFSFQENDNHFLPKDLIRCILRRNKGINRESKKVLAAYHGRNLARKCRYTLMLQALEECEYDVGGEAARRFWKGGPKDDDLEQCALDFAGKIWEWVENNVERSKQRRMSSIKGDIKVNISDYS